MKLNSNTRYLNAGNIFSRAFLMSKYLNDKNSIIITDQKNIKPLYEILNFLNSKIIILDNYAGLIDSLYNKQTNYIVSKDLFYSKLDNVYQIKKSSLFLEVGEIINIDDVIKKLNEMGYKFSDFLEGGKYKKLGDTIHLILPKKQEKIIISFFGDSIDDIIIDHKSMMLKIKNITIGKTNKINILPTQNINKELIKEIKEAILDNIDITESYEEFDQIDSKIAFEQLKNINYKQINLDIKDITINNIEELSNILKQKNITIYTKKPNTILNFIDYNNFSNIKVIESKINNLKSFLYQDKSSKNYIICDDNLSRIFTKKRIKKSISQNIDLMLQIKPDDYIVHIDHGIGVFKQIITKELSGIKKEYLEIEYDKNDKLFVPITEIKRVSKYVGKENPNLTSLNTKEWSKKLEKANKDVREVAEKLLEIYAKRKSIKGYSFVENRELINKFQSSFDFIYTNDQINAVEEILKDMSKTNPMDRILIGDVGFGKTEVAFNACYLAFLNKKQVSMISPLVVLAYEHYDKAVSRFKDFDIKIEILTRFEKASKVKEILKRLKTGDIDLIIGTHRLLSKDIEYKDLGLLIIDEEHKFGVEEKEKINEISGKKELDEKKSNNLNFPDVLSMSATPIPRSLNMALNGIKGVSILSKSPEGRLSVDTFVSKFDDKIITEAGKKEFERQGQLFFIHNRVSSIDGMGVYLQSLFPRKKIIITHGQLPGDELETRILDFKNKKYDILLSSTVIENGIDFPNVNTIIINDAYKFGISQIHQLRGRVGRSDKKSYCYLLFSKDKIKEDAAKRLQTIVDYNYLGAGFELSMKDLEIRGGGDVLGIKQSGIQTDIGINTFLSLLEDKIEELKLKSKILQTETPKKTKNISKIELNIGAYLGDEFFNSELDKINFYREIESISDIKELEEMIEDFISINDNIIPENKNFFLILKMSILLGEYKITNIKRAGVSYQIDFSDDLKIEDLKKFLDLDKKVVFVVSDLKRLRSPVSKFKQDIDFLKYLESCLTEINPKKIKLKKLNK